MDRLDRTKPYMEVNGENVKYKYIQEWRYYDFRGRLVDEEGNLIGEAAPEDVKEQEAPKRTPSEPEAAKEAGRPRARTDSSLVCPVCGFVAANQWAASAHKRTHDK